MGHGASAVLPTKPPTCHVLSEFDIFLDVKKAEFDYLLICSIALDHGNIPGIKAFNM